MSAYKMLVKLTTGAIYMACFPNWNDIPMWACPKGKMKSKMMLVLSNGQS